MSKSMVWRMGGFAAALAASAGLIASASGATGAYFNDTRSGTATGTIGSIKITTWGGSGSDSLDFSFDNLLPGTPGVKTVGYQNTGANAQDVWLVFPNATALHALNQLGSYGQVDIKSSGTSVFSSANLNDGYPCGTPGQNGLPTLCPVPDMVKLASNVAPNAQGSMSFSFGYPSKLKDPTAEGAPWNCYAVDTSTTPNTCTSSGLPYELVATQLNIAPNDTLNSNPTP